MGLDIRLGLVAAAVLASCLVTASPAAAQQVISDFGGEDAGPGRLGNHVRDIAVDSDGNVWVVDAGNARLLKYDFNGSFITAIGTPAVQQPNGIGTDGAGNVFVADSGTLSVRQLDTSGVLRREIDVPGVPNDVAIGRDGLILVSQNDRVSRFESDGDPLSFVNVGGDKIAADGTGRFYIDTGAEVSRYTETGTRVVSFGDAEFDGSFGGIDGLATGPDRRVYVAGGSSPRVRVYTPDGTLVGGFGAPGTEPGQLDRPRGIDLDCRGNAYVLDLTLTRSISDNQGHVVKYGNPATPPPPCGPRRPPPTSGFVARADDIEVTQGIQFDRFHPGARDEFGRQFGGADGYGQGGRQEIGLAAGAVTVVRVYASLLRGPAGGVSQLPATLEGSRFVNGRRIPLGTILADAAPATLRLSDGRVDTARRIDPAGAYTFTLPPAWTEGLVTLTAHVNPAGLGCGSAAPIGREEPRDAPRVCENLGRFRLESVRFEQPARVGVLPIALTINGRRPPADPASVFAEARNLSPLPIDVGPYAGSIEIGDLVSRRTMVVQDCFLGIELEPICTDEVVPIGRKEREALVTSRLRWWARDARIDPDVFPIGLIDRSGPGRLPGSGFDDVGDVIGVSAGAPFSTDPLLRKIAHGDVSRPRTIIAHELFHNLATPHAGTAPACYPDPDQLGEDWPPDQRGYMQGIGLDRRAGSGGGRGPYRILFPGANRGPEQWYDLMSYCASTDESDLFRNDAWISTRNWQRLLAYRPLRAPELPRGGGIGVDGIALADGRVALARVGPAAPAAGATAGAAQSASLTLEARSADGQVLASAPMTVESVEVVRGANDPGGAATVVSGNVTARRTATVTVSRDGEVVTARRRSANVPRIRVGTPSARRGIVELRWRGTDRDRDTLTHSVDYSADGGRRWRTIAVGLTRSRLRFPAAALPASRRARLRVRANDGFNEGTGLSRRFVSPGGRPLARISAPGPGRRVRADGRLTLQGDAVDDTGRRLRGGALIWRMGRRVLGRGEAISTSRLPAGRRTIVLEARDRRGRVGRARVRVRVLGVTPAFVRLNVPSRIARRARRVRLRVATNVPATLSAGRFRARVGPRRRTVSVPIRAGSSTLRLPLRLRSGGRTTRVVIEIAR